MKTASLAVAALALPLASCAISNHQFEDRFGAPDVQTLERARLEMVAKGDSSGPGDLCWLPLLSLNFETYSNSTPPWPAGTKYVDHDSYGPLFMFVDADSYHYDEDQEIYERNTQQSYFWGLYRYERDDVRVPSGWRYDEETSILFGLLRWPSDVYVVDDSGDSEGSDD